jgi:phosphoglycolate phosphatase
MTHSRRFDLVIFDWEGTISNGLGQVLRAFEKAAQRLNLKVLDPAILSQHLGLEIRRLVCYLYPNLNEAEYESFISVYHHYLYESDSRARLFVGMETLLNRLKADGAKLAILTCKGRTGLDRDLKQLALEPLFFASRTPSECLSKPDPEGIRQLMAEAGATAEKTVMIGDSPSDMEAARAAGVKALGVDFINSAEEARLRQAGASLVFKTVTELQEYLITPP